MFDVHRHRYLLFDGDCGICTRFARVAAGIDARRKFRIIPYFDIPEEELRRFGIGYDDCRRAIQLIGPGHRISRGPFAVNRFLWGYFPWSLLVATVYLLPPILILEIVGYRIVARFRHKISAALGMTSCKVRNR